MEREDFQIINTGEPHPDEPQFTKLEARFNGKLVQYIYEGELETMDAYTEPQLFALLDQAIEYARFDEAKAVFYFDD